MSQPIGESLLDSWVTADELFLPPNNSHLDTRIHPPEKNSSCRGLAVAYVSPIDCRYRIKVNSQVSDRIVISDLTQEWTILNEQS